MEESGKNDFESREYQVELYTQAIDRNLILYLPTGSGKTFIATLLIKEFNGNKEIKPLNEGGQRTFFLVNTVALVEQQAKQIRSQTILSVGMYSGDLGVDLWPTTVWLDEINKNQVLVMTCQIFVDLLQHNTIALRNINLLIFDECHRAVSNHPMRQVMRNFKGIPVSQHPRVLGLTATLLNGNISSGNVAAEVKELENTFLARIATSINEEMVRMYSTNPKEKKLTYSENETSGMCYKLRDQILEQLKEFVSAVEVEEAVLPAPGSTPSNARHIDASAKKINKRLRNLVDDIKVNMDDLGLYGGSLAVLAHMVQVQQMIPNCQLETSRLLYQCITADCTLLRKYFDLEMKRQGLSNAVALRFYSSDKVNKLLDLLKKLKQDDSAIVFVKRRFTAKILYYLVKRASVDDPTLLNIKSNFIVGYNIGNPFKDTRENYLQRNQNKKVMNQFNQGEINVLFASNVVEEGIDITQCNYVIMFDHPQDFRSYIQSKGRARDKNSNYIIMTCISDTSFEPKYKRFCEVETVLKEMLYGGKAKDRLAPSKEELDKSLFLETPGLEPFMPMGVDGPVVTCLSAVSLINRYFASLRHDKFTKVCPFWWLEEDKNKFRCHLQLPMESKVAGLLEGTWQLTKDDAKRSVALEACKTLHNVGELDRLNLLPIPIDDAMLNVKSYTPSVDKSDVSEKQIGNDLVKIGTKRHKRLFEKKWANCLCHCRPQPDQQAYLHVLDMTPKYTPPPNNNRLIAVHEILSMSNSFALISSKKLPRIAEFPLYMSTGELEVSVKDAYPIHFNETQLKQIEDFQYSLFDDVLKLAKEFMIKDTTNTQNAYLIAPVRKGASQEYLVDWDIIQETTKLCPSTNKKPSDKERLSLKITDENYLSRIVSPWYRTVPSQKYLITKVCYDMSENTPFQTEIYSTYKSYFKEKYKIEPLLINQPLIEVRAMTRRINCTKPRALTKVLKRKDNEENEDFEVWLLPEFCVVYSFPGKYWLKAELLPSTLHRISRLCMAEEIRTTLAQDTGIGITSLPQGKNWNKLQEDISLQKKEEECEVQQALKPLSITSKAASPSKSVQKVWGKEEEPLDIERNMDTASIFDIINYGTFINKPLLGLFAESDKISLSTLTSKPRKEVSQMIEPPPLQMLQNNASRFGPQQVEVMQALTAAVANDFINCERLETLGDSFLKFAVSLMLFETQPDYLEGQLTHIKGQIVGNKNLYFCGKKRNFGSVLEVQDFSPREEWVPPGFCVEHKVKSVIVSALLDPDCLYGIVVPTKERRAGILSTETMENLNPILFGADDATPKNSTFINQQALTDKNVADTVEAVLGVYLKSCGIFGALEIMNWFGVTNPNMSTQDIFTIKPRSPAKGSGNPNIHLQDPRYLEQILNYKFKDRCYLLQAMTHPSYTRNNITLCYQRLEFLGDALIDFLITVHIYEKCQTLSPGDLTDLRSALVNNITLGALSVRHQLYKFMLYHSSKLNDCMMRFVKHQEDRNHVIDDDILFLVEENEVNISEAVDVAKALGDIFEAIIGAIYLDSGKNLDITWKVVYNLMKDEIESFYKNIPKNQVRLLYETNCGPKFSSSMETDGAVMMTVEILHKGVTKKFFGFGDNTQQAKRAAAKHAMRNIRLSKP